MLGDTSLNIIDESNKENESLLLKKKPEIPVDSIPIESSLPNSKPLNSITQESSNENDTSPLSIDPKLNKEMRKKKGTHDDENSIEQVSDESSLVTLNMIEEEEKLKHQSVKDEKEYQAKMWQDVCLLSFHSFNFFYLFF